MKKPRLISGFTLIELLVVISIIGILAAVVLASLNDARERATMSQVQSNLRSIHTAMEMLYLDTGWYPHKQDSYCPPVNANGNEVDLSLPSSGLTATDGAYNNWNGPYIKNVTDPWGTPYHFDEDYQCTAGALGCNGIADAGTDTSAIVSCGPDGQTFGGGCVYNDDNIVYVFCRN